MPTKGHTTLLVEVGKSLTSSSANPTEPTASIGTSSVNSGGSSNTGKSLSDHHEVATANLLSMSVDVSVAGQLTPADYAARPGCLLSLAGIVFWAGGKPLFFAKFNPMLFLLLLVAHA